MSFFSPTVVGTPMRFSGYSSPCVSHGCLGSPGRNPLPSPRPSSVCPLTSILLQEEPQERSSSPPSQDKGDWDGGYHCLLPRTLRCDCFLCSAAQLQPSSHEMPTSHPQRLLQSLLMILPEKSAFAVGSPQPSCVFHQFLLSPSPTSGLGNRKWEFRLCQSQLHKLSECL